MIALGIGSAPPFRSRRPRRDMQVMSMDYIFAAKAANRPELAIAVRHVLPNIGGMLIVQCSVNFAIAVLAEAGLSFLGLGTMPPTPSWGPHAAGLAAVPGNERLPHHLPGLAIAIAVLGFNLFGDGLRDRLDPKLRSR